MVHSAMVPRGGSGFTAGFTGDAAGGADGSAVTAAFPRSVVGFITSTSLVYQAAGVYQQAARDVEDAQLRRAKCRYLADPSRSGRRGNRSWSKDRAAMGKRLAIELLSHCGVQGNTVRNAPTSKQTMMNRKMPSLWYQVWRTRTGVSSGSSMHRERRFYRAHAASSASASSRSRLGKSRLGSEPRTSVNKSPWRG